jgi:hypothetical protein
MSLRKGPDEGTTDLPSAADKSGIMTADQAVRLKALAAEAADPDAFDNTLTQAEADERILALETLLERERESGAIRFPRT